MPEEDKIIEAMKKVCNEREEWKEYFDIAKKLYEDISDSMKRTDIPEKDIGERIKREIDKEEK